MTVEISTLSNGLRVVTENMPGLESSSIGIWVQAGGRNERIEQNGIAHFLEHMAFKGTKRRNALQIAEAIEDVGGYINAYTSREVTAYYARVLREDTGLALDVISDILTNSVFDAREIEIERGVILQEIGQALDTPDDVIFDWLQEEAYPDQPIGRTILGPSERVRSFGRDDLTGFVAEHYGPEQMILSAAGAVDHDQLVKLAEQQLGGLQRRPQLISSPAQFQGGQRIVEKSLEQVHFTLGFDSPHYKDKDFYAAQVYSSAMGGGMSSRLFQEIREKRGMCYSIFTQAGAYSDTGMTMMYAGTSAEQIEELALVCMDEMKRAADDISEAEVNRARAQMKAGLLMGLESPSSRAERMARVLQIWDRIPDLSETIEKIDAVDVASVRAFGGKLITDTKMAMALYGPVKGAPQLETLKQRLAA